MSDYPIMPDRFPHRCRFLRADSGSVLVLYASRPENDFYGAVVPKSDFKGALAECVRKVHGQAFSSRSSVWAFRVVKAAFLLNDTVEPSLRWCSGMLERYCKPAKDIVGPISEVYMVAEL